MANDMRLPQDVDQVAAILAAAMINRLGAAGAPGAVTWFYDIRDILMGNAPKSPLYYDQPRTT